MLEGIHLKNVFTLEDREDLLELMKKEEGIKEGRKKGKEEERESIVKELIKLGQPLGIIKAASKFTEDKIRELAKSIGVPVTEE